MVRKLIDILINDDLYIFIMIGQFEEIMEYEVRFIWSVFKFIDEF